MTTVIGSPPLGCACPGASWYTRLEEAPCNLIPHSKGNLLVKRGFEPEIIGCLIGPSDSDNLGVTLVRSHQEIGETRGHISNNSGGAWATSTKQAVVVCETWTTAV